jgi:excisionase family DNA binding protein
VVQPNLGVLTVEETADLLNVTSKTVRNWINQRGLPAKQDGRGKTLDWQRTLEWYVQYRINGDGANGNDGNQVPPTDTAEFPQDQENLEQATTRKTIAEANLKELQLAEKRGQVVAVADVERNIAAVSKAIQQKILAIPSRLSPRLVGTDDRNVIFSILSSEANQICSDLATVGSQIPAYSERKEEDGNDDL